MYERDRSPLHEHVASRSSARSAACIKRAHVKSQRVHQPCEARLGKIDRAGAALDRSISAGFEPLTISIGEVCRNIVNRVRYGCAPTGSSGISVKRKADCAQVRFCLVGRYVEICGMHGLETRPPQAGVNPARRGRIESSVPIEKGPFDIIRWPVRSASTRAASAAGCSAPMASEGCECIVLSLPFRTPEDSLEIACVRVAHDLVQTTTAVRYRKGQIRAGEFRCDRNCEESSRIRGTVPRESQNPRVRTCSRNSRRAIRRAACQRVFITLLPRFRRGRSPRCGRLGRTPHAGCAESRSGE